MSLTYRYAGRTIYQVTILAACLGLAWFALLDAFRQDFAAAFALLAMLWLLRECAILDAALQIEHTKLTVLLGRIAQAKQQAGVERQIIPANKIPGHRKIFLPGDA